MINLLENFSYFQLTILGGLLVWLATAAGASLVFIFKQINTRLINIFLGFSAGVMLAASIWSLIIPAMQLTKKNHWLNFFPVTIGIIIGALFIFLTEKFINLFYDNRIRDIDAKKMISYFGKKNFTPPKSFFFGQLSGFVEPIGTIIGYIFINISQKFIVYILGFAAGAMLYVVFKNLIPESQSRKNPMGKFATILGFLLMMVLDTLLT